MVEHKIVKVTESNELNWWLEIEGESVVLKCANFSTSYFPFKVLSVNRAGQGFLYGGLVEGLGLLLDNRHELSLAAI